MDGLEGDLGINRLVRDWDNKVGLSILVEVEIGDRT